MPKYKIKMLNQISRTLEKYVSLEEVRDNLWPLFYKFNHLAKYMKILKYSSPSSIPDVVV